MGFASGRRLITYQITDSLFFSRPSFLAPGNSICAQWCADNFRNAGRNCVSLATRGTGPCFQCGPSYALYLTGTKKLCSESCVDIASDNKNCGDCGKPVGLLASSHFGLT